jgi:hypothetical protein
MEDTTDMASKYFIINYLETTWRICLFHDHAFLSIYLLILLDRSSIKYFYLIKFEYN